MSRWDRATVLGGLLGGLASASGMALTATSGWLIVRASERPIMLTLMTAIVAVRTFGIARPVLRYWERLVSHDGALRALAGERAAAFAALIPLTPARLGRRRRTDVLTAVVEDLSEVVESRVRVTVPALSALVAGVLAVILAAAISPAAGLVIVALELAIAVIAVVALRLESASQTALLVARAEVTRVSELVSAQAGELRAIGATEAALGWLDDAHATLRSATRRQSRGRALAAGLFLVAVGGAVVAMANVAAAATVSDPVKALLVVLPVAAGEVIAPLVDAVRAAARARASRTRLAAVLDQTPAVSDTHGALAARAVVPAHPDLVVDAVTASWTGERRDVGPVSLSFAPGSRTAITGPNGCGKSTLLAVLARHLEVTVGRYELGGIGSTSVPVADVRDRIAFADDEPHVFATTLRGNLALAAPDAADPVLVDALRRAGLGELLASLPGGLDERLGAGGRSLSGGERARLEVARAIVSRRPVILLDEPVAHLDPPTARAVLTDLVAADADDGTRRTLVMVTHRPEGLDLFDRTVTFGPAPETTGG